MKNHNFALLLTGIAFLALPQSSYGANATGDTSATIVAPIAIVAGDDLIFGKISAGTGGTVLISVTGTRSIGVAGVTLVSVGSGHQEGTFDVTGEGVSTYAITLPAVPVTLTSVALDTMSVGTFVSSPSGTGTLVAGAQTISVGATLTVGNAQPAGEYTGTFVVSVEYN